MEDEQIIREKIGKKTRSTVCARSLNLSNVAPGS